MLNDSPLVTAMERHYIERQRRGEIAVALASIQTNISHVEASARAYFDDLVIVCAFLDRLHANQAAQLLQDPHLRTPAPAPARAMVVAVTRARAVSIVLRRAPKLVAALSTPPPEGHVHVLHAEDELTVHVVRPGLGPVAPYVGMAIVREPLTKGQVSPPGAGKGRRGRAP